MSVRSGDTVTFEFTTRTTAGVGSNADSLPTGTLVVNGTDNAAAVTVTNVDTGRYKASVTLPVLSAGDLCEVVGAATVGGTHDKSVLWRDSCGETALAADGLDQIIVETDGATEITARDALALMAGFVTGNRTYLSLGNGLWQFTLTGSVSGQTLVVGTENAGTRARTVTAISTPPLRKSLTVDGPANLSDAFDTTFDATGKKNVTVSITANGTFGDDSVGPGSGNGYGGAGGGFAYKLLGTPGAVIYRMQTRYPGDVLDGYARVTAADGTTVLAQAAAGIDTHAVAGGRALGGGTALAIAAGGSTQTGDITHAGGNGGLGAAAYYAAGAGGGQAATISGNGDDGTDSTDTTTNAPTSYPGGGTPGEPGSGGAGGYRSHVNGYPGVAPGGGGGGGASFSGGSSPGTWGAGAAARFVWSWEDE